MLSSMRPTGILSAALAFAMVGGCGAFPGGEVGPGVLVIAIDGLRADHLGCLGYDRPATPTMDELAADGVLFTQAFSTAPLVLPSHVSLFTGCDPIVARRFVPSSFEGLEERRWLIPERVPHLAVELLSAGFRTAAFVDDPLLDPVYGFKRGFQKYDLLRDEEVKDTDHTTALTRRLVQWLRNLDRGERWYAYLHVADLERFWGHPDSEWDRYFPAREDLEEIPPVGHTDSQFFAIPSSRWQGGSRTVGEYEASYAGHLRKLDGELQDLLARLRAIERLDQTTVVVVGSFGIQFGEAGLYLRGGRYSMADLHVPLIVRPRVDTPDAVRGRRVDAMVSLMDVAPTVLALEGVPEPGGMHGVSQAAWVAGAPPAAPLRRYAFASCGMQSGCAVIGERYCLEYLQPGKLDDVFTRRSWLGDTAELRDTQVRFYDRIATPYPPLDERGAELQNPAFLELRRVALVWLDDMKKTQLYLQRNALVPDKVDEEDLRKLREKGYLGEEP